MEVLVSAPSTLADAVNRYLEIRRAKVAENTYKNDRVAMNALLDAVGRNAPLHSITRELLDTKFFGAGGIAHAGKASTFNAYLSRMRRFTQTAVAYGWMARDPLAGMEGRRRAPAPVRQILPPSVLLQLVDATRSPRDRVAMAIAVNTGLRANEIAQLRVGDVHMGPGFIDTAITKTADHDRMPITADLERELVRWFDHYRLWADAGHVRPDWFLVPQNTYTPRWGAEDRSLDYRLHPHRPVAQPYDIVKRALAALQLPTDQEGFHTIRRSVGRAYYDLMRKKGGHESALVATAALLHHKDIRQTMHYIGVAPERLERDAILKGQPFLTALAAEEKPERHLRVLP
jgi:integrase